MNLLTWILVTIPLGILFIMLWICNDYRKYKKANKLAVLLLPLFPITASAQYMDTECQISFKCFENQKGKLEYTKDEVTYKFIPNETQWEIIICNNSSEDLQVNWKNMQLIINGKASEVRYPATQETESSITVIKGKTEIRQKIALATGTTDKANSQIYNKREVRKGKNSSITIILPISIGKCPQFFTSFDFIIRKTSYSS